MQDHRNYYPKEGHARQELDVQEYQNKLLERKRKLEEDLLSHRGAIHKNQEQAIVWGGPGDDHRSRHQI